MERQRTSYDEILAQSGFTTQEIFSLDATHIIVYRKIVSKMGQHFHGAVLDVGAGRDFFRTQAPASVHKWISLDYNKRSETIDVVASAVSLPFEDRTFDCVLLADVLEHLPNPEQAIREIRRVLKDSGLILVSCPFFLNLHEAPFDYTRYSEFGLREVFSRNGYEVLEIEKTCGPISTMGYWITAFLTKLFRHSKPLLKCVMSINRLVQGIILTRLDGLLDKQGKLAQGNIMIARKIVA